MTQDNTIYNDDSIQSLNPREHVRLRPGLYAGDISNPNQLFLEIFSNALDEHIIGHGDVITIHIEDDYCSIEDNGQGFPVNVKREDGKTVLQASFDEVNTSGKFDEDGVYGGSALGLNGLGSKLTNFLSKDLVVKTVKNKVQEVDTFKDGILESIEVKNVKSKSGTTVSFHPDEQFFESGKFNIDAIKDFIDDITCLCPSLTVIFNDEEIKHNSIEDLLIKRVKDNEEITNRFTLNSDSFQMCMTFTTKTGMNLDAYVNYGKTEQGPHIVQLKSAITRTVNKCAQEAKLLKAGETLSGTEIQEGMTLVFNLVSKFVSYNAQIKTTVNKCDTSFVNDIFVPKFIYFLDNNPQVLNEIVSRALLAKRMAEAARKAREAEKNKGLKKDKIIKMPTKLVDCWTKDREKAELLICEGDSAAAGLVDGRNEKFQAVYGVRGKMLNVLKASDKQINENQEINNIIQALGLEYDISTHKMKYDYDRLRYGKIIACADADPDGYLIENLLFNILWFMCPDLFLNGHVYSAIPPLFRITNSKNQYLYLRDQNELDEYKAQHPNERYLINRLKGLGEMDSDEAAECLMDEQTRNIVQLDVVDYGATDVIFNDLYGKKVQPRIDFLKNRGN